MSGAFGHRPAERGGRGLGPRSDFRDRLLLTALLLIALLPWPWSAAAPAPAAADAEFSRLVEEFLDGYLAWRPQLGTMLGLHQYDGKVTDFRRATLEAELARLKSFEEKLARSTSQFAIGREKFHDQMLSHGMPPLPLLREILLKQESRAGEILPGG
ncbi:MAG: hypothetical protein HY717_18150 [Planctomycetes bacterium]|nr:hypothetical protein [Planctomycetota bacterium]